MTDVTMTEGQDDAALGGIAVREGLSWSWHLDLDALATALSEPAPWNRLPPRAARPTASAASPSASAVAPAASAVAPAAPAGLASVGPGHAEPSDAEPSDAEPSDVGLPDASADPVEADFADYLESVDAGRSSVVPLSVAAGRVAEILLPGPDLAAWLASNPAAGLEDGALAGTAAAYRRVAAWAQAGELAVVAQLASRSAAADPKIGVGEDGRPVKVPADACGQVSLALTMSQAAAQWWTGLAVDLQWRLASTGAALREGCIDLPRAKAIAEATAPLDDDQAKAVEAKVLPRAGDQTAGQLRASLRRAVITADPDGAERRREEAEQRAKVTLYPDADGTATLAGQNLSGVHAAAAMARMTALAQALKASGGTGGIDLLRSKIFVGLLLGTLPFIPPPPGGPADGPAGDGPADTGPAGDDASSPLLDDWPWNDDPAGGQDDPAGGQDDPAGGQDDPVGGESAQKSSQDGQGHAEQDAPPGQDRPEDDDWPEDGDCQPGEDWPDDEDCQPDHQPVAGDEGPAGQGAGRGPVPWPEATPLLAAGPAALKNLPLAGSGFLELRLPWVTLARGGPEPGYLTRLGPVTPVQASYLALLAAQDPATEWRVVLTGHDGRAIAVTRTRPARSPARAGPGNTRAGPISRSSLLRRVTVIMPAAELTTRPGGHGAAMPGGPGADGDLAGVLEAIITAARRAASQAAERAAADAAAGGCAHAQASAAYQVPAGLREFVSARDLTCRFPTCRQPAWRCDADHTRPHDQDGPTCSCNLGCLCRYHHQLKQHPRWRLDQTAPGTFTWTTPTGRAYTIQPDAQAA
jgi:hypothetical protein